MRVLFLVLVTVSIAKASILSAQSVEQAMAQAVSEMQKANARFESEIAEISNLKSRLSGLLSMTGCDCDVAKGSCSVQATLTEGQDRSELVIKADVQKPYCVRVGTYITTQWDIDNNTPAYESFTFLREPEHSEWIYNTDWNGRQPILLDDVSCRLCATGPSQFCEESSDVAAKYGPMAAANAQAAQQMEAPVSQMKASGAMVELANLSERQMGLMYQIAEDAQSLVNMVQSARDGHCN